MCYFVFYFILFSFYMIDPVCQALSFVFAWCAGPARPARPGWAGPGRSGMPDRAGPVRHAGPGSGWWDGPVCVWDSFSVVWQEGGGEKGW